MTKDNIDKKCVIRFRDSIPIYRILDYSENHGGQYLLRATASVDDCLLYGWEDAKNIIIVDPAGIGLARSETETLWGSSFAAPE